MASLCNPDEMDDASNHAKDKTKLLTSGHFKESQTTIRDVYNMCHVVVSLTLSIPFVKIHKLFLMKSDFEVLTPSNNNMF